MHVCGNFWVHACGIFWVHVCGCWVHVYKTVGCTYADVGCKSMERLGVCLTVGSYTLHVYPVAWAQAPRPLAQGVPAPAPGPFPVLAGWRCHLAIQ